MPGTNIWEDAAATEDRARLTEDVWHEGGHNQRIPLGDRMGKVR